MRDDALSLSLDALRALQLERLQSSLRHAWTNQKPWRAACDARGVAPDDLRTLEDVAKFPFTLKEDLRVAYPFGMLAVPRAQCVRLHASSGTTGRPTVVGYTAHDIDTWARLMARAIGIAGGRPGDIVHVAYGYGLFTGGLGAHYGAERLGCTVVPMSGGQTEKQVQLIREFGANVIMCTPSYMLVLADEMERQGVQRGSTSLRVGIHGAEPWTAAMRSEIEARVGIDAVDIYGISEVMGPGVACEFAAHKDGATLFEDHFWPEIIDPLSGAPLPDGAWGELVLTSLTKEAMPVMRYRTRDLTRLLPGTGSRMRRLARLTGRSDDMMIIRGVNLFPSQVEEQILAIGSLAPHYLITLDKIGPLDRITIQVEPRSPLEANARDSAAATLAHRIKSFCGVSAQIEIAAIGSIERSLGKARRVDDRRPR